MALLEFAAIKEVIVVAQQDATDEDRLVAYVVSKQEPPPSVGALRNFLKDKLPEHMVPSGFMLMDALPLTPNGKVDRQALPPPDHTALHLEESFVAPRNAMEEQIAAIWSEVLKLEQIGIHNDFFDLGGHSLSAAQVMSRVREVFHVELPLRLLLEGLTIADMAAFITREQAEMSGDADTARILTLPDREQGDL